MGPLDLVQLTALMDRTSGRAEISVGLIDGPVLLTHPELVTAAWDYFNNVQNKDIKYKTFIRPGDKPAIWLNQKIMEQYRPEMKKMYYDPSKYDNYLEQLGIKYPTVH